MITPCGTLLVESVIFTLGPPASAGAHLPVKTQDDGGDDGAGEPHAPSGGAQLTLTCEYGPFFRTHVPGWPPKQASEPHLSLLSPTWYTCPSGHVQEPPKVPTPASSISKVFLLGPSHCAGAGEDGGPGGSHTVVTTMATSPTLPGDACGSVIVTVTVVSTVSAGLVGFHICESGLYLPGMGLPSGSVTSTDVTRQGDVSSQNLSCATPALASVATSIMPSRQALSADSMISTELLPLLPHFALSGFAVPVKANGVQEEGAEPGDDEGALGEDGEGDSGAAGSFGTCPFKTGTGSTGVAVTVSSHSAGVTRCGCLASLFRRFSSQTVSSTSSGTHVCVASSYEPEIELP